MPQTPILSGESRVRSTAPALHATTLSPHSLQHESDERLVALTRAGSERAFAEITRRYQRPLRAYCSRLVGSERAQDAVQQALLQAFLSLRDRAPREIALRPWLYRIAHNCAVDLLRMGSWDYDQLDLESDGVPQPPALFEQKEELRGLVAGMRQLPEAQRRALTLRELEGCSYEEISARLGHSGSGVRQLIFRARSALRKGASAALIPFGLLRERLVGMSSAVETHHVTAAAAVPAHPGGAETVGAAALAVLALLGGVAHGVRSGQGDQRRALQPVPAQVRSMVPRPSPAMLPAKARAADRGAHGDSLAGWGAGGVPVAGLAQIAPPAKAPAPAPAAQPSIPAAEPNTPASSHRPGPDDSAAVGQQSVPAPAGEPESREARPAPPAPDASPAPPAAEPAAPPPSAPEDDEAETLPSLAPALTLEQ
jgi:RNA polymerase sigma factor (sigma-70 family)